MTEAPTTEPDAVAKALGHSFRDPNLLRTALTHPSWSCEHRDDPDNQRLEFLGDAVVGLRLAERLFERFPDAREGELTRMRASLASGEALARKADALGLGHALRLGRGQVREGGDFNVHNLADAMEAVLGAVCADAGYNAAAAVFDRLFADEISALRASPPGSENPRSELQILASRKFGEMPQYTDVSREGSDSAPVYTASVVIAGRSASGTGRTKRGARAAAAAAMLKSLRAASGACVAALAASCLLCAGCSGKRSAESSAWEKLPPDAGVRMYAYDDELTSISPRDAGTEGAARASRWIAQQLRQMGYRPVADCWTESTYTGRRTFCNVWAEYRGRSRKTVVLGSHYDTKSGIPDFKGANDGGSSTAVLLGLAEHLAETKPDLKYTVRFAFFDGEESVGSYREDDGLHGSRRMAFEFVGRRNAGEEGGNPLVACIVADMVGDRRLALDIPRNVTPWLATAAIKASLALKDASPPVSIANTVIVDDHVPFVLLGFPAIDLIDFDYGSAPGRHDWWHTAEDTMDKIDAGSLHRTATLLLAILSRIERGDDVPQAIAEP